MLWAEVRELVATSSAARLSSGDAAPPAAGPQGTPIHSSTKGISNELVIARLRGKVDHLTTTLESSQQALTQAQSQLQNQQHQVASAEDQARLDQVSRDLARANVQKKELEQLLSKSAAEAEEREAQTKQLTVRVQSLAAALQDKEAQAASLSALEKRVQELHLTIQELEPKMVPAQTATKPDAYVSLKALEHVCERLSLGQRQTLQELADVQAKLTAAEAEANQLSERVEVLMLAEERSKEYSAELATLKEQHVDTVAMLEAVRKRNTTLEAQGQQMLRDAEKVSNIARERAASLSEKSKELDELKARLQQAVSAKEESLGKLAAAQAELQVAQTDAAAASHRAAQLAAEEQARAKDSRAREQEEAEMVWTTTELALVREKHEAQTRRVAELEMQLARAQGGGGGSGGEGSSAREAAMAADMIASLRQIVSHGEDQVELLHEHMATLSARATQVNTQPEQPQSPGDDGVQDAEAEGGNAHRKAYSVEEWRSLLAVRSLNGFGSFGIKRPVFSTVRHTYFGPNS
eukprot:Tamp_06332.p1 GENE.Tamp_06332~~Tamp_06332.p1  ORF type:complete len:524 (-),score=158.95 Tamp_06332:174-1745(-)